VLRCKVLIEWFVTTPIIITLFVKQHVSSGLRNKLHLSVNLILVPVPPFQTHLFLHLSLLPLFFTTTLIHNSLSLSFTLSLKPTSFPLLLPGLPSWTITQTISSEPLRFHFQFFLIFFIFGAMCSIQLALLQLLSACKYTISYHIVFTQSDSVHNISGRLFAEY